MRKSLDLYLTLSKAKSSSRNEYEEDVDNSFMERELAMDKV